MYILCESNVIYSFCLLYCFNFMFYGVVIAYNVNVSFTI